MRHHILVLVSLLVVGGSAIGQTTTTLYKSTGPDGKTVYSDRPPTGAKQVKTLTFKNGPASPLSAQTLAYIDELKKSLASRASPPPSRETTLYSAAWCGYCKKAKAYLASKQIAYRELDVDTQDGLLALTRAGGRGGVPLLVVDGKSVTGFSAASYDAIFASQTER